MKISRNTVATVNFVVTDQDGKVVGRTDPKHPIEALIGHGSLVIGLEQALDGREKGDSFSTTLNPALAYGEIDNSLIQTIDKRMFGDFPLEVGNVFEADTSRGRVGVVVKEIREKDDAQLVTEIASLKEELYQLRFEKATGTIENPNRIREVRKTIAKMMTVQNERKLSAAKGQ